MSANPMRTPPLRLRIAASPLLAGALLLAHGAAIACAILFLPGWAMPALASVAIAGSFVFHVRRDALQLSGDAVTEFLLQDGARCEFTLKNGQTLAGNIECSTFVAPLLIVIHVSPQGQGRHLSVVLMPDSAPAGDLRRVRVWLRHGVGPDTPGSGPS
jgi:hypothetical protein